MPLTHNPQVNIEHIKLGAQVVGTVVTWLLVFGGWYVSNNQNAKRDARKELRERIDSLIQEIWAIEDLSIEYLSEAVNDKDAPSYWSIISKLARLTSALSSLTTTHNIDVQAKVVAFRQAITKTAISGPKRKTLQPNDPLLGKISAAANQLADSLDRTFFNRYPAK